MHQRSLLTVFISANVFAMTFAVYSFYNIECKSFDKTFLDMEYCYIKAINRSFKYISLKLKMYKLPITNVKVNAALCRRDQGWKTFFFNITFDGCQFLESKKRNPIVDYVYNMVLGYSNLNHTCPYNHDIILENVTTNYVEKHWGNFFPLPPNDYRITTKWSTDGILRLETSIYLRVT